MDWISISPSGHLLDPGIEPVSLVSPALVGTTATPGSHVRLHSATSLPPHATPQPMNAA